MVNSHCEGQQLQQSLARAVPWFVKAVLYYVLETLYQVQRDLNSFNSCVIHLQQKGRTRQVLSAEYPRALPWDPLWQQQENPSKWQHFQELFPQIHNHSTRRTGKQSFSVSITHQISISLSTFQSRIWYRLIDVL